MKKVLSLIALAALCAAPAFAFTYTNTVGQVFDVNVTPGGQTNIVYVGFSTQPAAPAAGSMTVTGPGSVILAAKGATTTPASYTPTSIGCVLIGQVGTTNTVWIATGSSASSWLQITNLTP